MEGNATLIIDGFSPASPISVWTLSGGTDPDAGNTPYQPALISPVQVRDSTGSMCDSELAHCSLHVSLYDHVPCDLQSSLPWPSGGSLPLALPPQSFIILLLYKA